MTTAVEYLKINPVFHIATVDGTKARVRPFGFSMKRNNALYFCTNKTKDVYKQMSQTLRSDLHMGDGTWLRIRGRLPLTLGTQRSRPSRNPGTFSRSTRRARTMRPS